MQRARPTKVAHGQRSGRHEPGMVVGFACAGTENTWCARRTLPHAQFFLLIFQALSSAPRLDAQALAEPPPYTPCGCEIGMHKGSNPQQHGSICGRVRRAHQRKILQRCTFPPMFPDNKAVQPCLALQADIRPAISFGSPAVLTKFAEQ